MLLFVSILLIWPQVQKTTIVHDDCWEETTEVFEEALNHFETEAP